VAKASSVSLVEVSLSRDAVEAFVGPSLTAAAKHWRATRIGDTNAKSVAMLGHHAGAFANP